jgi:tyrosyl-tRNA synthetase
MKYLSELLNELDSRGLIKDCTDISTLDKYFSSDHKIVAYAGFDLTATSLHVGHLLPISILRIFHKYGHKVIFLLGGGTSKIGDPSFRDESRSLISEDKILENKEGIQRSINKFIKPDENIIIVDNNDWLGSMNYLDFMRDVGVHFSVNKMLGMDSVKTRISNHQHLSFLEFNYMLLQGYDFLHLYRKYNCMLQIGGSDQWGNIIQGVELIDKKEFDAMVFGLTSNLITRSDGKKMGKSASGAVWINEEMLDPYEYYQYFRNTHDDDVKKFMLIFTDLSVPDINDIISSKNINDAKKILAFEVTKICHGNEEAKKSEDRAVKEFENRETTEIINVQYSDEMTLIDALIQLEIFKSKGDARKMIQNNGIKINDVAISADIKLEIANKYDVSVGKKKRFFINLIA